MRTTAAASSTIAATTTINGAVSRRSQSRSVWGCLTCRRRKVKCRSRETPCETCCRLGITCTPSFGSNFKQWKTHSPQSPPSSWGQDSHTRERRRTLYNSMLVAGNQGGCRDAQNPPPFPRPSSTNESPATSFTPAQSDVTLQLNDVTDSCTVNSLWWDPGAPFLWEDLTGDMAAVSSSYSSDSVLAGRCHGAEEPEGSATQNISDFSVSQNDAFSSDYAGLDAPALDSAYYGSDVSTCAQTRHNMFPHDMGFSFSVRSLSPRLEDERTLVDHYRHHMFTFFSVRASSSATWNFYAYALKSTEGHSDSPLRHGILAWTSAHLNLKDRTSSRDTLYQHYHRARAAANDLLAELQMDSRPSSSLQFVSERLHMLLSTSLFLSFCDLVSADIEAVTNRLFSIKTLLSCQWEHFRERLGPLDSRILVWLAYLDLRSSFWVVARPPQASPLVSDTDKEDDGGGERGQLFNFLVKKRGFPSLRSRGRFYLTECFGSSYPEQELQDDLLQEPARLLADDALSIFSKIVEFEAWDDNISLKALSHPLLIQELRCAKLEAIRADIARVRAECKVVNAELLQNLGGGGRSHIGAHTEYLCLTGIALHQTATIMLNRVAHPDERTDDEAQASARDIIRIARRLQKLGFRSPRTFIWPVPVFIAGIEVDDDIYQDWVLEYMREMASAGYSTQGAGELLARVMEEQAVRGRRVRVRDVMRDFAMPLGASNVLV